MGATIDELQIQVAANASNASRNLTTLAKRLGNLQEALSGVDVSKFNEISNSLNNLGDSTKNLKTATNGLQNIGKNLNNIGRNVNNLNRGGGARTFFSSLNSGAKSTTSSMGSLAAMIGKFYATYFMAIRGVKKLASSTKTAMDYVETFNYFNAAMEQVTSRLGNTWKKAGYNSAEEYKNAFVKGVRDVTAEMTGFQIDSKGNYNETSGATLGLNLQDTMKYQAQFAQMSSSMGVASDSASKLSEVLVKLGGDLASVKNVDFTEAWSNLSSGMVGMSRTVDKYGINIRNANLQTELTNLGIEANINKLGQQDKALLRTIVMLNSTKYAWADLSDTINQPANQLRLLQNNFKMLGQSIGNIFLPIVQKLLPYLNAMVIALQRFATWLGKLFGFDMSKFTGGGGVDNSWMSDLEGDAEGTEDALGGAANNAKKLKQQLLGIDELNNLTSKDDKSGSGVGGVGVNSAIEEAFNTAAEEYLKVWNEAYKRLEDKTKDVATQIEAILLKPIRKFITDLFHGDFEKAGKDLSDIFTGIFDSASDGLKNVKWAEIGNKIGEFLKGIEWTSVFVSVGNFIETLFDSAMDMWVGAFKTAPIETAVASAMVLCKFTGAGKIIANNLGVAVIAAIGGFSLGKQIGKAMFPDDAEFYDNFSWLGDGGFFDTITSDFETTFDALFNMAKDYSMDMSWKLVGINIANALLGPLAVYFYRFPAITKYVTDKIISNFDTLISSFSSITKAIGNIFVSGINAIIGGYEKFFNNSIKTLVNKFLEGADTFSKFMGGDGIDFRLDNLKLQRITLNAYKNGGVVEDGLFMANHNELIGGFQGKTAVANNEQITRGIADAVRDANTENNRLLAEQNEILLGILRKTGITDGDIASSVRRSNRTFRTSTGYSLT